MINMKLMLLPWEFIKLVLKKILYYPELYLVHSEDGQQNKGDSDRQQEVMNFEAAATSDLTRLSRFRFQVPVEVPVVIDTDSVKKQLPVVQYRDLILRKTSRQGQSQATCSSWEEEIVHVSSCIVCMNGIEGSDVVRELCNCEHVFHRDCLDGWIDQAHLTCPLCRSELFIPATSSAAISKHDKDGGSDPWRAERMVYLFGQDIYFEP